MRAWNDLVAAWSDVMSLDRTALALLLIALIGGLLWMTWPAWSPRRLPRRPAFDSDDTDAIPENTELIEDALTEAESGDEELPELDPAIFAHLADQYAEQGLWAQAVRERFRAMIRHLVEHGVVQPEPGWTVTELARAAAAANPALAPPITSASEIFSQLWYAQRPATAAHDRAMRKHVGAVRASLHGSRA